MYTNNPGWNLIYTIFGLYGKNQSLFSDSGTYFAEMAIKC